MKMTPNQRKFYMYVMDLALNDKPCPVRAVMAEQIGINPHDVSRVMRELRRAGIIEVELINLGWNKGCNRIIRIPGLDIETASNHAQHDLNPPPVYVVETYRDRARKACDALLRRQLQTGAHWIRDPGQFRAACESVGLAVA